ncbi:hypothetical protein ABS755_13670 [Castellaniella sp. FW104-16D08]|uniref:hypothetical protein n=1 Tax=unclassified Castellaniella TaxID=2617606 RepID=UPI0033159A1D
MFLKGKPEIDNDVDALLESFKSGATRNAVKFQGNGLYGTLEICRVRGGKFSLNAGNAALICAHETVSARRESVPFTGTTVDAFIDFSKSSQLERALAIDGRIHQPIDYIEQRYEQNSEPHLNPVFGWEPVPVLQIAIFRSSKLSGGSSNLSGVRQHPSPNVTSLPLPLEIPEIISIISTRWG